MGVCVCVFVVLLLLLVLPLLREQGVCFFAVADGGLGCFFAVVLLLLRGAGGGGGGYLFAVAAGGDFFLLLLWGGGGGGGVAVAAVGVFVVLLFAPLTCWFTGSPGLQLLSTTAKKLTAAIGNKQKLPFRWRWVG